jgi:hypothetical protein
MRTGAVIGSPEACCLSDRPSRARPTCATLRRRLWSTSAELGNRSGISARHDRSAPQSTPAISPMPCPADDGRQLSAKVSLLGSIDLVSNR